MIVGSTHNNDNNEAGWTNEILVETLVNQTKNIETTSEMNYGINVVNDFNDTSNSEESEESEVRGVFEIFESSEQCDMTLNQNDQNDYHQGDDDYESNGDFSLKEIKRRNLNDKDDKNEKDNRDNRDQKNHQGRKDHKDDGSQNRNGGQQGQVSRENASDMQLHDNSHNKSYNNSYNNSHNNSHSHSHMHKAPPVTKVEMIWNGKKLTLETGRIAKQASSVYITYGGTSILCSVAFGYPLHDIDFLPLNVVYQEKSFAIGKIPNGFIKRETKPSDNEILISRIIDRSVRPLFSHFLRNDIQIICDVKDYDGETDTAVISVIGASAALMISGLPISECIACAKVGKVDNSLKSHSDNNKAGGVNLLVSGGREKVFMIECESDELSENEIMEAIQLAMNDFQPVLDKIHEFAHSAISAMTHYVENEMPKDSVFKSKLFQYESNLMDISDLCDMNCEDIFEDKFFLSVKHVMFRKIYDILEQKCGGMNFFELSNDRRKKIIHYTKYGLDISSLVHEFLTSKNFHGHWMNSKKGEKGEKSEGAHNSTNDSTNNNTYNSQNNTDEGDDCDYALADHEHAIKNALNHAFLSICVKEFERLQAHEYIFKKRTRLDGRKLNEIRDLHCETGVLKHSHGSAIFTRGMTQSFASVVVGLQEDSQVVDDIFGERRDRFMLHYNFPPFAVGDTGRMSAPGRREIGHGNLAKKAFSAVLPSAEKFPYTIRAVSDITESDGSSSMASVCSVNAALVNSGIPIESNVAGIAMGLLMKKEKCASGKYDISDSSKTDNSGGTNMENMANLSKNKRDDYVVLTDILGSEDALGDMDFKIAGTEKGITALQMDIKCSGVSLNVLRDALSEGGVAYRKVLGVLNDIKKVAFDESKILTRVYVGKDRIREIIGVGGRVVKDICQQTGAKLSVQDAVGEVLIFGHERARSAAEKMIKNILNRWR